MGLSRRRAIAYGGSLLISGCIGDVATSGSPTPTPGPPDADNDDIPDKNDDYPNDDLRATQIIHKDLNFTLKPDEYKTVNLETGTGIFVLTYDMLIEGDYPVDCLVMSRENYVKYLRGDDCQYLVDPSSISVGSADIEAYIDNVRAVLVFDYTTFGTDYGPGFVDVQATVDVAEAPFSGAGTPGVGPG